MIGKLDPKLKKAVRYFWKKRGEQISKQTSSGQIDAGQRGAVTGGAQMDGFISLCAESIEKSGIGKEHIFFKKRIELPGYFRPTKEWDLIVVKDNQLILAIEVKSQVGPSFGNNFNNRTEEAMGSALDLWTAYREGAFNATIRPWLGYIFLLEKTLASQSAVKVKEPHFKVFPEFEGASYEKRYEIFCRKLVRERHYNAALFVTSPKELGVKGIYFEPAQDLCLDVFRKSLAGQIASV